MFSTISHRLAPAVLAVLSASVAPAQIDRGEAEWNRGMSALQGNVPDYQTAMKCFLEAAKLGHVRARFDLGVMYVNGEGVAPDVIEGYAWYSLAAKDGDRDAEGYLRDLERFMQRSQITKAKQRAKEIGASWKKPEEAREKPVKGVQREPEKPEKPAGPAKTVKTEKPARRGEPASAPGTLRFVRQRVSDPMANGIEAFSMLIPSGWRFEGGVLWNLQLSNLASAVVRISGPEDGATYETLPLTPFAWTQGGVPFMSVGQNWLGGEVRPQIMDPTQFVSEIVIPRHLPHLRGGRHVETENMPELARMTVEAVANHPIPPRAAAARVRVEFSENGRAMEQDIYVSLRELVNPYMTNTADWGPVALVSFKAEKGKLDRYRDHVQVMWTSVRLSPLWYGQYSEVYKMWLDGHSQSIQNAGRISKIISKNNDEILAIYRSSYENQQRSQERISDQFSRYVRGVERYEDPVRGESVSLPSGYDNAWVSSSGEYILTNDTGTDPNVGSTVTWQRMQTTPLGR